MTARVHLELLSKQRLIALTKEAQRNARREQDLAAYWRHVIDELIRTETPKAEPTPAETMRDAASILRRIGTDPDAEEHRDVLRSALNYGGSGQLRKPGPRCTRGCDRPLNQLGFCPRCQSHLTRKALA